MPGSTLRTIVGVVLAFHGVGHAMGIIPALGIVTPRAGSANWLRNWSIRSRLLTGLLGELPSRVLGAILYLVALVGFLGAALALAGWGLPHDWWRTLAVVSAAVSLAVVSLYWNGLILLFPHKVGALAVSVATLGCLLVLNWPTEAALGF